MTLREWLLALLTRRYKPVDDVPEYSRKDIELPVQAIQESTERLRTVKAQRSKVDEVVCALEDHLRANHFGERLDNVFTSRK